MILVMLRHSAVHFSPNLPDVVKLRSSTSHFVVSPRQGNENILNKHSPECESNLHPSHILGRYVTAPPRLYQSARCLHLHELDLFNNN